ncbi:HDOD domain-containing protein [Steroidobacter sp. S1-65]|uniref:HDOD domain-containing protein n=1 Tax=Steroidobacter gossypii TaxID=2805490 RepID=A0ABS1WQG1_9GAMM|nr:HDOD domain-containing protein [Steroidobacter gossypii]MBM0103217.1 HDOD domain-containing protein [Steroidobacter gossypii]
MTLTIVLIAAAVGLALFMLGVHYSAASSKQASRDSAPPRAAPALAAPPVLEGSPFETEATASALAEYYKLAFNVSAFDYDISGEHAAILSRVNDNAAAAVHQREYFPRRPMLLPKLLQVLNDDDSTRKELVRLLLEDPALAGSALQRANSAAYRYSPEPVDTLDRAVVILGNDGLRSLLATAILQPVFRQPKGYFDNFATITWEHARCTGAAAEACARALGKADPFIAQVIGLLGPLARIVLFRLTMETYREHRDLQPRAEVFIRAMQLHAPNVAGFIASTWELSDPSIRALQEQTDKIAPATMSPLGQTIYFGELCGALALLAKRGSYSEDGAKALLMEQGLGRDTSGKIWQAAMAAAEQE